VENINPIEDDKHRVRKICSLVSNTSVYLLLYTFTRKLAGKTIFITGASRGIGKAIALKAAKDGANIAIAAKTAEQHSKLPGTIYSAAEEIEKAGGKCLPCKVDIRNENEVEKAVEECVRKFGGIDILINNASAISLTGTLDTSMKKYDLMHQVNSRGTFLVSQKCIPYLKSSKNPHILNLSPPLNMKPVWFAGHVGMSAELKPYNIAVNALWPRTAIWTAAMNVIADETARKSCRKSDILADAAYVVLTRDSKSHTGQFYVDEQVLKAEGVTNFDQYSEVPGSGIFTYQEQLSPEIFAALRTVKRDNLLLDLFLPEAEAQYETFIDRKDADKTRLWAEGSQLSSTGSGGSSDSGHVSALFKKLQPAITPNMVQSVKAVYKFQLTGSEPGVWYLDLKNVDKVGCGSGEPPAGNPDVVFTCDSDKLVSMFSGRLKPTIAFMTGQLKIGGNLGLAMKLEKLMGDVKAKL
uniref:Hydroxysteroid dehydrogenase-like protein 2 n=1 Tax=Romanomermis culicivorax TaxID=13658 RepID=A0A915I8V9_ROMCU